MKKKTIIERPYEVEIEAEGNILKGLSPIFGPKGTQAFFLDNTLYIQTGIDMPEETNVKTIPSMRNNIYKELPEVLTVDGIVYVAKKTIERRKGLEEILVAGQTNDQVDEEQIEELPLESVTLLSKSPLPENPSPKIAEAETSLPEISKESENLEEAFKYVIAKLYIAHKQKESVRQGETQRVFDTVADDIETVLNGNAAGDCDKNDVRVIIDFFNRVMNLKPEEDFMQALALFKDRYVKNFLPQFLRHIFYELTGSERVKLMDRFKEAYNRYLYD